jgi:protocatechuate 3,4-dioxygenase beta subunit
MNDLMKDKKNRRKLLKDSAGLLGVLGLGAVSAKADTFCKLTATQPEGPFYPIADQADKDIDLTQVKGKLRSAKGQVVILKGVISGHDCKPIKGAMIEIWQACDSGKYNHPGDPNPAALDPNFQYWGRATTNAKGEYSFKTIKPGRYRATSNWVRPPHIHVKVHLRGYEELITQIYFSDEKDLNSRDRLLQALSPSDQKDLVVDFKKQPHDYDTGKFDITLKAL